MNMPLALKSGFCVIYAFCVLCLFCLCVKIDGAMRQINRDLTSIEHSLGHMVFTLAHMYDFEEMYETEVVGGVIVRSDRMDCLFSDTFFDVDPIMMTSLPFVYDNRFNTYNANTGQCPVLHPTAMLTSDGYRAVRVRFDSPNDLSRAQRFSVVW